MADVYDREARSTLTAGRSRTMCEACERGDHANCGMQNWCECDDDGDGDPEAMPDCDPEPLDFDDGDRDYWSRP